MVYELACADTGDETCPFLIRAETVEEIIKHAGEHIKCTHKVLITPQMVEDMRKALKRVDVVGARVQR